MRTILQIVVQRFDTGDARICNVSIAELAKPVEFNGFADRCGDLSQNGAVLVRVGFDEQSKRIFE